MERHRVAPAGGPPDAVAVSFEARQLTYRELDARANQLAWYLKERGVGPESRVGLCVERSLDMVVGILGILKAGGAWLPLDPTYPVEPPLIISSGANDCLLEPELTSTTYAPSP